LSCVVYEGTQLTNSDQFLKQLTVLEKEITGES
jgi:hypothetical protein